MATILLSAIWWALLLSFAAGDASSQPSAHDIYGPLVPRGQGLVRRDGQVHPQVNASVAHMMLYGRNDDEPDDRNLDGTAYGPSITGCLYCPELSDLELRERALLDSLTTEKMKTYMRKAPGDRLHDKCVFYTSSLTSPDPRYLSKKVSEWACRKNKLTIWHMWPNKAMERTQFQYRDFYGIYEPVNWLNSIPPIGSINGVPPAIVYFENMSEAIAESCSGEVVVVTQSPMNMKQYVDGTRPENIWKNKERPALEILWRRGVVSKFYVANYDNMDELYDFNIVDSSTGDRVPSSVLESRAVLEDRESCDSNGLDSMPPMGDPFSDDYSLFA